ncbi:hypothetical protein BJ085DRAFT_40284 [Dimargaris cristalligena]|uniref:Uncharacterized protein n=1 Tax=Dimargaris cristalligena TaxID=215637 RepID=A0A4V1J436_9FUNG|nr:hypothetical protein BJ085DRAFT_40284 [Dimargaris cristalligena]|eukprot:RKP34189.1 hypothetical protein BJ085DRAFT_40284 [Dimargaris cristalligena]
MTEEAIAPFTRQVALHANIFTQVFLQSGVLDGTEYVSNWRERLRQIKMIKERALAAQQTSGDHQVNGGGGSKAPVESGGGGGRGPTPPCDLRPSRPIHHPE